MGRCSALLWCWVAALVVTLATAAAPAGAATTCEKITDAFSSPHSSAGSDFLVEDLQVDYLVSGPVQIVRSCTSSAKISADDGLVVEVTRPDGSTSSFSHDFSAGCSGAITPAGPFDIASRFGRGTNAVKVRLRDLCGQGGSGSSDIYLKYEPLPVVFVHGFAASRLGCGGDEHWPSVPDPGLDRLLLAGDGVTNAPPAGGCQPSPLGLIESAAGSDVHGRTLAYVDELNGPLPAFAHVWDWRKSPEIASADLEATIDDARAAAGADRVVILAHSMGGQVTRLYLGDPARADKVARALIVGTPFWGSPKALFPLAGGVETPLSSGLDAIIPNGEFKTFARNLTGGYFLFPSESYGPWLDVIGQLPDPDLDTRPELLDYIGDPATLAGNAALLNHALDVHAATLDAWETNGVDVRLVAGSGMNTILSVELRPGAGADLMDFENPDRVEVFVGNGDETVPLRSSSMTAPAPAAPVGESVPVSYACGISHVPLVGDPAALDAVEGFLRDGSTPELLPTPCPNAGFLLEVSGIDLSRSALPIRAAGVATRASLESLEQTGGVDVVRLRSGALVTTNDRLPVTLSLPPGVSARVTRVEGQANTPAGTIGPFPQGGTITTSADGAIAGAPAAVPSSTGPAAPGPPAAARPSADRRPPTLTATVRRRGGRFVVTLRARDPSGIRRIEYRLKPRGPFRLYRRSLKLSRRQARALRWRAVDRAGNVSRLAALRFPAAR